MTTLFILSLRMRPPGANSRARLRSLEPGMRRNFGSRRLTRWRHITCRLMATLRSTSQSNSRMARQAHAGAWRHQRQVDGSRFTSADGDGAERYGFARATDTYRRPVAFVHAGAPGEADGTDVMVDIARLKQTVNYTLMTEGPV